jgi:hypothetical protein
MRSSLGGVAELTQFLAPMETTTGDSMDHAFCVECFPPDSDMIVSLCGKLKGDEPVFTVVTSPCVICYSEGIACRSCGAVFN